MRLVGFALVPLAVQGFYPGLGGALGIITPLPLAYGMRRRNILEGLLALSLVALLTSVVNGPGPGLYFLVETLPLCLGIYWAVGSLQPAYLTVIAGSALVAGTGLTVVLIYSAATGVGLAEAYRGTVESMGLLMESVTVTEEITPENRQQLQWMIGIWKRLFVGFWLSSVVVLFAFYSSLIRRWLHNAGIAVAEGRPFLAGWAMPFPFVGVFIGLAALVILGQGTARDVGINILLPLTALYGIQGLLVLALFSQRWTLPPLLLGLILFFLAMQFPVALFVGVALVGLFDTWFDFRTRLTPSTGEPTQSQ